MVRLPGTTRQRLVVGVAALSLVVAGAIALLHTRQTWSSIEIVADRDTVLQVSDTLSVIVPVDAAPAGETLRARQLPTSTPAMSYLGPLGKVEVELSSGQPTRPLLLRLRLPEPLATNREPVAVHPSDSAAPEVRAAQLSPDRLTVTADLPHLSFWEIDWRQIGDADLWSATFGEIFGTRFHGPECEGNAPKWTSSVDFLAGDINAPLLVCTGRDPADANVLVVKIVNNRGVGVTVTAPVKWEWVWLSGTDVGVMPVLVNSFAWVMQRLHLPDADRSLILAPGQAIHFGFRDSAFAAAATPFAIKARPDLAAVVFGFAWTALEKEVEDKTMLTALELGVLTRCMADAGMAAVGEVPSLDTAGRVAVEVLRCVAGNVGPIMEILIDVLPGDLWDRMKKPGVDLGRVLKLGVDRYLIVAEYAWRGLDAGATLALWVTAPAAFAVTIHLRAAGPATLANLRLSPHGVDRLVIGLAESQISATGLAYFDPNFCADIGGDGRWRAHKRYEVDDATNPGYRRPAFLMAVYGGAVTAIGVYNEAIATTTGVRVGHTFSATMAAYGTAAREVVPVTQSSLPIRAVVVEEADDALLIVFLPPDAGGEHRVTSMHVSRRQAAYHVYYQTDAVEGGC